MDEEDKIPNYQMSMPHEMSITIAQYILSPDVPPAERKYFEQLSLMFSKTMATANINKWDIPCFLARLDEICLLIKLHLYQDARELMTRVLMQLQLSRSIDGFWTLYGQTGIIRQEHINKIYRNSPDQSPKRKSLFGMFRKKREPDEFYGRSGVNE